MYLSSFWSSIHLSNLSLSDVPVPLLSLLHFRSIRQRFQMFPCKQFHDHYSRDKRMKARRINSQSNESTFFQKHRSCSFECTGAHVHHHLTSFGRLPHNVLHPTRILCSKRIPTFRWDTSSPATESSSFCSSRSNCIISVFHHECFVGALSCTTQ